MLSSLDRSICLWKLPAPKHPDLPEGRGEDLWTQGKIREIDRPTYSISVIQSGPARLNCYRCTSVGGANRNAASLFTTEFTGRRAFAG